LRLSKNETVIGQCTSHDIREIIYNDADFPIKKGTFASLSVVGSGEAHFSCTCRNGTFVLWIAVTHHLLASLSNTLLQAYRRYC
jgi:hypothetical protein